MRHPSVKALVVQSAASIALLVALAAPAKAQLLSTGPGTGGTTYRSAFEGIGQGVSVGANTTLTSFGFWGGLQGVTSNVLFMIWGSDQSSLLFSAVTAIGGAADGTLLLSAPLSFNLLAGQTYYFGMLADAPSTPTYFYPPISPCSNGLCLVGANANFYGTFASPVFGNIAGVAAALQLNGTQSDGEESVVPEPATATLLATGFAGLAAARRRRRTAASTNLHRRL